MNRKKIEPPLINSFSHVYDTLMKQSESTSPVLQTTGNKIDFTAKANKTQEEHSRRFIDLPHNNRIYSSDWGYITNSMGKDGQRIGQYSVPLDKWVTKIAASSPHESCEVTFEQIIDDMPELLRKLTEQPMMCRDDIGIMPLPQMGVYAYFEDKVPIYVGRSNNLKRRLKEHCSNSADRYTATFAFRIAINDYEKQYGENWKKISRQELESSSNFKPLFEKTRSRVSKMGIKVVEIEDQIVQTIFEVYAAMKLNTLEYNSFDNH